MKSKKPARSTSKAEVISISQFGIWILVLGKEYFLSAKEFPWFHSAKVEDVLEIRLQNQNHIRWESLDIDLDLRSLDKLEQYPLVYAE